KVFPHSGRLSGLKFFELIILDKRRGYFFSCQVAGYGLSANSSLLAVEREKQIEGVQIYPIIVVLKGGSMCKWPVGGFGSRHSRGIHISHMEQGTNAQHHNRYVNQSFHLRTKVS